MAYIEKLPQNFSTFRNVWVNYKSFIQIWIKPKSFGCILTTLMKFEHIGITSFKFEWSWIRETTAYMPTPLRDGRSPGLHTWLIAP